MMRRNQKKFATVLAVAALLWGGTLSGSYTVNAKTKTDIINGENSRVDYDTKDSSQAYIVIGDGSVVFVGKGGQERAISPTGNAEDAAGAIAIGNQTYARSGSIMIGSHNFKGNMGDMTDIDSSKLETEGDRGVYGHTVATMTVGTNSFTKGFLATTLGNYNIQTSKNVGYGVTNKYNLENFGATVVGTLNSNESYTSKKIYNGSGILGSLFPKSHAGIANSIVGIANKVNDSNGALVYGAGNEITNSQQEIKGVGDETSLNDTTGLSKTLRDAIKTSNGGGATMAFGGGNVADYTNLTMITGVNNKVKGTESNIIKRASVIGYQNTVTGASDIKLIGNNNTIEENASDNILFGDNYTIKSGKAKNVILGSASSNSSNTELTVSNATILGYNANVTTEGGVALGSGSIASTAAGAAGYDPSTKAASTETGKEWKATWAAVSVGDGNNTRQITGVAAGIADTDAVNVAQLKKALENAGSGNGGTAIEIAAGDGIRVEQNGSKYTIHSTVTGGSGGGGPLKFGADEGTEATVNVNDTLTISGDNKNISTEINGKTLSVKLKDDISVNSVTINNGPTINNNGIDMKNTKITNLADGDVSEGSHDAVTGGQLWNVEQSMNGRVSRLDTKIDRVGAGAAAMANLHPLDFDPEDKWSFSAGFGNYRSASAMAVGAFYRPNERTLFSLSSSFGNGENMLGLGASFKIGKESPKTRANLQKTIASLEETVRNQEEALKAQVEKIARLEALVEKLMER